MPVSPRAFARSRFLLAALGVFGACDDGGGDGAAGLTALSSGYKMTGSATAALPDGGIVECALDLILELRDETARDGTHVVYAGIHGGDMMRSVRAADDSGTTFWINVYGDIIATLTFPDAFRMEVPVNVGTGSRFYESFSSLTGTLDVTTGIGHGAWTCAPLDTEQDGHPDREHFATGTWTIEPFEVEPEPPEDGFELHQ